MKPDKLAEKTKKDLLEIARKLSVPGRSSMSKADLIKAISKSSPVTKPKRKPAAARPTRTEPKDKKAPPSQKPKPSERPTASSQPPAPQGNREPGPPRRRGPHSIDPAMKLSRVEEIRASSPGRGQGRGGHKGGGRGSRQDDKRGGRPRQERDNRFRPQSGSRRGRDWERGDRRSDRRDRHDQRSRSRDRRDYRGQQPRDHYRRSDEGRRPGGRSRQSRHRDQHQIDAPSPAPIPSRLSRKVVPQRTQPEMGSPHGGHPLDFPDKYGIDRLAMMARDPYWIHAYWEVTPESTQRAHDELGDSWDEHRWILRIHVFSKDAAEQEKDHFDVDLNSDARNWYFRVPRPDCSYEGTIGVLTSDGTFYPFARSTRVTTPRDSMSDVLDEEWTSLPEEAEEIYALSGGRLIGESSGERTSGAKSKEQQAWFSGMLGSMGSGAVGGVRHRGFWFQVNTELIVYGATEADAKLTVQGRVVKLRPDGTFTLRFQLPDGVQEIPCVATSADGTSTRRITPMVQRQTDASEQDDAADDE